MSFTTMLSVTPRLCFLLVGARSYYKDDDTSSQETYYQQAIYRAATVTLYRSKTELQRWSGYRGTSYETETKSIW